MKHLLELGKNAALLNLLAGCSNLTSPANQWVDGRSVSPFKDYSLRELAGGKMHHNEGSYLNPFSNKRHGNMFRVLRWKLFSENKFRAFYPEERMVPVSIDWAPIRQHRDLSVTFLKHASVLVKDKGKYIIVDPVFSGIFSFIKDFTPLNFDLRQMPRPDHVLITHGHYDHLDTGSLAVVGKDTHVITPLGYDEVFSCLRMPRRTQLDWFDFFEDGKREITLLPCDHWTMRNPLEGPNKSLWGSYMLRSESGPTIFISGDTAYFDRFGEIGREFSIDLAIINLGAYEPRWFMAGSHMNPAETVRAFKELGARRLVVIHWGTFRLGDEPVFFPPLEIKREMERKGLLDCLVPLRHGETLFV